MWRSFSFGNGLREGFLRKPKQLQLSQGTWGPRSVREQVSGGEPAGVSGWIVQTFLVRRIVQTFLVHRIVQTFLIHRGAQTFHLLVGALCMCLPVTFPAIHVEWPA